MSWRDLAKPRILNSRVLQENSTCKAAHLPAAIQGAAQPPHPIQPARCRTALHPPDRITQTMSLEGSSQPSLGSLRLGCGSWTGARVRLPPPTTVDRPIFMQIAFEDTCRNVGSPLPRGNANASTPP